MGIYKIKNEVDIVRKGEDSKKEVWVRSLGGASSQQEILDWINHALPPPTDNGQLSQEKLCDEGESLKPINPKETLDAYKGLLVQYGQSLNKNDSEDKRFYQKIEQTLRDIHILCGKILLGESFSQSSMQKIESEIKEIESQCNQNKKAVPYQDDQQASDSDSEDELINDFVVVGKDSLPQSGQENGSAIPPIEFQITMNRNFG